MPEKSVDQKHHAAFEEIRHIDDEGNNEFWLARSLAKLMDYSEYRHFLPVVERAREACRNSGYPTEDHFEDILEMVDIFSGARRELPDVRLTRYACYLIVQNDDPKKPVIASGQTYFAMQTRRQELADDTKFAQLGEDDKRMAIRKELASHNKQLAAVAKDVGVDTPLDYAIFQDHGYKGRYGGLGHKKIHAHKGLAINQKILAHTCSTELAASDLWCIASLPGGVFSAAGAWVKTNLLFFTKGRKTERIWYFDLSHVKVGKKTPITLVHFGWGPRLEILGDAALPATLEGEWREDKAGEPFPTFAHLLAHRGTPAADSDYCCTLDFVARRARAHAEMAESG